MGSTKVSETKGNEESSGCMCDKMKVSGVVLVLLLLIGYFAFPSLSRERFVATKINYDLLPLPGNPVGKNTTVNGAPLDPTQQQSLLKAFCPDPNYKTFDQRGCKDPTTLRSCEQSVFRGWRSDTTRCETKWLDYKYGDRNCMLDGRDHCEKPLFCTPDEVSTGVTQTKCMHGFGSRILTETCLPFGKSGLTRYECAIGYCHKTKRICTNYQWGEKIGLSPAEGCNSDKDCFGNLVCYQNSGVCYKRQGSVEDFGACKLGVECHSNRCKISEGSVGLCQYGGPNEIGSACNGSNAQCSTGCCFLNQCSERNLCVKQSEADPFVVPRSQNSVDPLKFGNEPVACLHKKDLSMDQNIHLTNLKKNGVGNGCEYAAAVLGFSTGTKAQFDEQTQKSFCPHTQTDCSSAYFGCCLYI